MLVAFDFGTLMSMRDPEAQKSRQPSLYGQHAPTWAHEHGRDWKKP